jgi:peptide methionine sulfoxide reductase MsrB
MIIIGIKMVVICKECGTEMEYKKKYGSKNEGVYKCKECGNFVYEDTMEKKAGKTIVLVTDEET